MTESPACAELRQMGLLHGSGSAARLELSTSGTTTAARTVVRTLASWEDSFDHVSQLTGITSDDRVLVPAPPGGSMFAFARAHAAHVGASVVALDRWSAAAAEQALTHCTVAHLTPTMLDGLLDRSLGSLRTVVCAGAALPDRVRARAGAAGVRVVDYYGATELSFVAMRNDGRLAPFPEVEVDIRDGVIWARSPWLALGYASDESGPMLRDESGFATVEDRGELVDGDLRVHGRGTETITTGGATVLAADVEAALTSIPGVMDAVVVGSPHPTLGEVVEAVVVLRGIDGGEARIEEIRSLAATLMQRSHLPRRWHAWPRIPMTRVGKIDRGAVRDRLSRAAE